MNLSSELISSIVSIVVALLGGGALVKIIELFFTRSKYMVEVNREEKDNLRGDIASLRSELQELREQVDYLRDKLNERNIEIAQQKKRFFALKLAVEKIIIYLRTTEKIGTDQRLEDLIKDAYKLMAEDEDPEV